MFRSAILMFFLVFAFRLHAQHLNLYPDSIHHPFVYGVASGDPKSDGIIIWTAVEPDSVSQILDIIWQIAADTSFSLQTQTGVLQVSNITDFTCRHDVSGLNPNTQYFYRFITGNDTSAMGITYTAPTGNADSITVAIISCSSLFSGYFNAYRNMSEIEHLRAIIHLGDYIYDFVDPDERVRVPVGMPNGLSSLQDWRGRHKLYLADPDLREARRKIPFILIWDNHDLNTSNPFNGAKAFFEYNPIRMPSADTTRIWRNIQFGNLLEVFMIDMLTETTQETFASGNFKIMTHQQSEWLKSGLGNATSVWKMMGSQKFFSPWELGIFASLLPGSGLSKTWNGYAESRDSLLHFIQDNSINNFVVAAGDLHMSLWSDLSLNPFDSNVYNPQTGLGCLGVEVMGTSVSRGNLDEAGLPISAAANLYNTSKGMNPQQQYLNLYDHGYTLLKFTPDSMTAYAYLNPILSQTNQQTLEHVQSCWVNQNRWRRNEAQTSVEDILSEEFEVSVYPNPAQTIANVVAPASVQNPLQLSVFDSRGKLLLEQILTDALFSFDISAFARGIYVIEVSDKNFRVRKKLALM